MKPSPFRYHAPRSVDECVALLAEHGDDAKLLAGGQSLVPLMNLRLAAPEVLVDVNRIAELDYVRDEGDRLAIGALTRHRTLATSETVRAACPILGAAAELVGYPAIRNRGTLGGSLAHADPASELPCVAVALDAELVAAGPRGRRTIAAGDFFLSHFTTVLEPDELLIEARFPRLGAADRWAFVEFSRKSGDFAVAAVAAELGLRDGRIGRARIGVGGVGERAWRAKSAEQALVAADGGAAALDRAAECARAEAEASADGYRSHVVATLTRRALERALNGNGTR